MGLKLSKSNTNQDLWSVALRIPAMFCEIQAVVVAVPFSKLHHGLFALSAKSSVSCIEIIWLYIYIYRERERENYIEYRYPELYRYRYWNDYYLLLLVRFNTYYIVIISLNGKFRATARSGEMIWWPCCPRMWRRWLGDGKMALFYQEYLDNDVRWDKFIM